MWPLRKLRTADACDHLGLPDRSYEVIHGWLLPVLDLEASRRDNAVNQGHLPPVSGLGHLSKRSRAPQGLRLPANCL